MTDLAEPSVLQQHAVQTPVDVTGRLLGGRLKDLLAGKKILMTGVTGFIGEQLLWKILTDLPETSPAVLVRRKRSAGARDRMVGVLKKEIFADLRDAAGGIDALLDDKIDVIEGDLPNVPTLPGDIDIVVHCAGDVSFDPPIDQAFTTNVIGTKALMDTHDRGLHRRRRHVDQDPALRAHLHRLHRGPAARCDPGGGARALDRLRGRDGGGLGHARADRGRVPHVRAVDHPPQAGRAPPPGRRLP